MRIPVLLAMLAALPMGEGALAQTVTTTAPGASAEAAPSTGRLVAGYTSFAGSSSNAQSLVTGLRTGSAITLEPSAGGTGATPVTFTAPTRKLGTGEVNISLALAKAELGKLGITNPTPQQLQAALVGGTVTTPTGTVAVQGVLQMRSAGEGWGLIAQKLGFKLGEVVRHDGVGAARGAQTAAASRAASANDSAQRGGRPDSVVRPERPDRPERPERPDFAGGRR